MRGCVMISFACPGVPFGRTAIQKNKHKKNEEVSDQDIQSTAICDGKTQKTDIPYFNGLEYLILCKKAKINFILQNETKENIIELAYYPVSTDYQERRKLRRENQSGLYLFESYSFFGDFVYRLICDESLSLKNNISQVV
jgi:hypothetical protein